MGSHDLGSLSAVQADCQFVGASDFSEVNLDLSLA